MARTHILGFPRIGAHRELKFAQESFWRGESDEAFLLGVAKDLRDRHWELQRAAKLDFVTVGDFAYYDQMLNLSALLGALPARFEFDPASLSLSQYYELARGNKAQPAMEMTKWFDTNYHYLVPELGSKTSFDGGVDWEGTFVDPHAPNLLTDLPAGVLNFPDYTAGGLDPNSTAAKNIRAAGYPPDIVNNPTTSLWTSYWAQFWEVTQCQWQKRLDPGYDTYGAGTGTYNYVARLSASDVGANVAAFETTGRIQRPLVTVAGTMDGLLPIDHHARAYARKVAAAQSSSWEGSRHDERDAPYRLYEVQNGNHIETFQDTFPQLALIEPHAHEAFDALVAHVETRASLPASQCVPKGGAITQNPAQPGHCAALYAP